MNTKKITVLAILLAVEILLSRFCSISLPLVKIGFAFIPVVVAALMYGPIYSGLIGGLGDFLGAVMFPIGPYFPGFTVTAAASGVVFGLLLYGRQPSTARIICASALSLIVCSLVLDTIWLEMLYAEGIWAVLPSRLIKVAVMLPLEVVIIGIMTKQKVLARAMGI